MISHYDLTETSPGAASQTVLGTKFADNLDQFSMIAVYFTTRGATGGTTCITLQCSHDGGQTWFDWYRSADIAAGAAATTFKVTDSYGDESQTTIGTGTASAATPALAKGTVSPGIWGKKMRAVFETGAGVSVGASQGILVVGMRPSG